MWGGGVIGWQASPTRYTSHSFSGQPNSCAIGCLYTVPYSAIVYRLKSKFVVGVCTLYSDNLYETSSLLDYCMQLTVALMSTHVKMESACASLW